MAVKVDPITMACVAGSLETIVREMSTVMLRTSRSGIFKLAQDFSDTLLDSNCKFIVIGKNEGFNHVASASAATRYVADYFGNQIYPGDMIYHNDSVTGGGHLPDCALLRPIFWEDELVAWSANKAHVLDIGGDTSFNAKDIYGEGIRIPPTKIYERGIERRDVFDLILANVRFPDLQRGDMKAQIAASAIGEKRWLELISKYTRQTVDACIEELFNVRERDMRAWIKSLEDGTYEASALVEYPKNNTVLEIGVSLTVQGDEMHIKLNSPPQVPSPINSYKANTMAGILIALSKFGKFGRPLNEGLIAPINVDFGPEGTLLNAALPAPCMLCTTTPQTSVIDMVTEALSKVVPLDRQAAGWQHVTILTGSGIDPRNGKSYSLAHWPAFTGGAGAVSGSDGYSGIGSEIAHGAQSRGHLEHYENDYPIRILQHQIATDSGGAGKWRGGASYTYEFEPIDHDCEITIAGDDRGVALSLSGAKSTLIDLKAARRIIKTKSTGDSRKISAPSVETLHSGESLQTWVAGGGGLGSPFDRPVSEVMQDVVNEVVSIEGAREDYGVIINPEKNVVDTAATELLRKQRKAKGD